jgi:hypothetical protein
MRPSTSAILATAAAAASMVLLAGCGGDGPEGAPPPPATTKAAPARNAAAVTPRLFVVDANGNDAREAFTRQVLECWHERPPNDIRPLRSSHLGRCVLSSVDALNRFETSYPSFKVEITTTG